MSAPSALRYRSLGALSGFEDILTAPMALFAGVRPPVADTDMPQVQWQESPPRIVSPSGAPQVIPEGGGPVKTNLCVVLVRSASFLVLAGRVEAGVGVKTRAEPDRVAAVGP